MTRITPKFLLALIACCLPLPSLQAEPNHQNIPVDNLLKNHDPGFECPGTWRVRWGNPSYDPAVKHSGQQSLKIVTSAELESPLKIRVEPGYEYYFSAWGKVENFHFISDQLYGCGLALEELRADGVINGNWYSMYRYLKYKEGNEDWVYMEAGIVPKETTVWLLPAIKTLSRAGSVVWYDDIRVWKKKLPEKKSTMLINTVENNSFEIKYNMGYTPFGFDLFSPDGKQQDFGVLAAASMERASDRGSSLKLMAPCTVKSGIGAVFGNTIIARISALSEGGNGFANVVLLDAGRNVIKTIPVATLSDHRQWQTYDAKIAVPKSAGPVSAQWVFGMTPPRSGTLYFDDLQLLVESTLLPMPIRKKNPAKAQVTVDAAAETGNVFQNPLDAFDYPHPDRINSPTIGTAGPHLEGPNRWFEMRKKLGINYIRLHNGFNSNTLCEHLAVDGKTKFDSTKDETGVTFNVVRTDDHGNQFPPVCQIKDGKLVTDFSSIQYYLEHGILNGGMKPIFGLEPVPGCLALNNDSHYKPRDMKLWEEFNYRFIKFLVDTYGAAEIRTWIFETGNEPSTEPTFHGRPDRSDVLGDFLEMQDYTVAGCRRALPDIFIAGPSGPPEPFIMPMIKHCAEGKNFATGEKGSKLDAISYHGYLGGTPNDLSWRSSEEQIFRYLRYREYYEKLTGKKLALYNTEFAAIYHESPPRNPPEPAYENHIQAVGTLHMVNFSYRLGVEHMAYFYAAPFYVSAVRGATNFKKSPMPSNTPEFYGESTMITFHGIFKPVTRISQMLSWLNGGNLITAKADCEPIFSLAVKDGQTVKVLCYSFDVDPSQQYVTNVNVKIDNLGKTGARYELTRYELSATKANSWYLATKEKLTQEKCEDLTVVDRLNRESELKPEKLGQLVSDRNGTVRFTAKMPAFSASLFVLSPAK